MKSKTAKIASKEGIIPAFDASFDKEREFKKKALEVTFSQIDKQYGGFFRSTVGVAWFSLVSHCERLFRVSGV